MILLFNWGAVSQEPLVQMTLILTCVSMRHNNVQGTLSQHVDCRAIRKPDLELESTAQPEQQRSSSSPIMSHIDPVTTQHQFFSLT